MLLSNVNKNPPPNKIKKRFKNYKVVKDNFGIWWSSFAHLYKGGASRLVVTVLQLHYNRHWQLRRYQKRDARSGTYFSGYSYPWFQMLLFPLILFLLSFRPKSKNSFKYISASKAMPGVGSNPRSRNRCSFCICSLPVPHSSTKPIQMKSSMTFIQSNR